MHYYHILELTEEEEIKCTFGSGGELAPDSIECAQLRTNLLPQGCNLSLEAEVVVNHQSKVLSLGTGRNGDGYRVHARDEYRGRLMSGCEGTGFLWHSRSDPCS